MAKRTSRQSPEDQNILDKLRSFFGGMPPKGDPGRRKFHFSFWYFLMALLALSIIHDYFTASQIDTIPYSEFKRYVVEEKVQKLSLKPQQITGILKEDKQGRKDRPFVTVRVEDPELVKLLDAQKIDYKGHYESKWLAAVLSWVLPLVFFIIVWRFLIGRMAGGPQGVLSVGKARAKIYAEREVGISFDDIAGIDEARQELEEIVEFLKTPEKFTRLGGKIPKGVLLVGAPGTGKTLLAKAVAGESGVPFFSISGSEFVEMFVGVGASRVRDLFKKAKENSPCIVFIDEIDAVGRQRGTGIGGGNDEREQTLNQLLTEMDGFKENKGVIVVGATNRVDILDAALLRPGRFDRQITVGLPDRLGRLGILKVHARNKPLDEDVSLVQLANRTPGFSGADLANLLNESAILATRYKKTTITKNEVNEAADRIIGGIAGSAMEDTKNKKLIAYHEVGHAIVGSLLENHDAVEKVTLIPRGGAKGLTWFAPEEDQTLVSRSQLLARITTTLGGRVAEKVVFGDPEITTGASNDLQQVTNIARQMVTRYGMSSIGPIALEDNGNEQMFLGGDNDAITDRIDSEVCKIVNHCEQVATKIILDNRVIIDLIVEKLLDAETITGDTFRELVKEYTIPPLKN